MPVAASKLYAVQVLSGKEAEVQRMLLRLLPDLIEDCFTPEYETVWARKGAWVPVRRMLLPGYLFIQTKEPEVVAAKLAAVPAFTRLLGGDGERFMPLGRRRGGMVESPLPMSRLTWLAIDATGVSRGGIA